MRARFRSWCQYIKKHWVGIVTILALTIVIVTFIIIIGYQVDWFGFNAYDVTVKTNATKTTLPTNITVTLPYKTLYDWLQLLIVPLVLTIGGFWLNGIQRRREERTTEQHAQVERQIAKDRYEQDQRIAEQRYRQDQELALDKQREDLLQSYLDRMAELLLEKELRTSQLGAEVRKVARTRTISTLTQLDGKRARTIFLFLDEAQLIEEADPIISFEKADLSGVKWSQGNLGGFNLSGANLCGAKLNEVNLSAAELNGANLNGAELNKAKLIRADLTEAELNGAELNGAELNGAELIRADLKGAKLRRADLGAAKFNGAELYKADLDGANLSTATLSEANLSEANLSAATLSWADLKGARLIKANLNRANLIGADLSEAYLVVADLNGANLIQANLTRADLTQADLSGAQHLKSACLAETILRGVTGLTPEQRAHCKLSGAFVDEEATPLAPPAQTAAASSSQETIPPVSPSLIQAVPLVDIQEATSEVTPSQEHPTVEEGTQPLAPSLQDHTTPLSSSQEDTSPAPPLQGNATPLSPSQEDTL